MWLWCHPFLFQCAATCSEWPFLPGTGMRTGLWRPQHWVIGWSLPGSVQRARNDVVV
ncbi:hypothetical protein M3J09_006076 [Ascochyta lentis]